MQEDISQDAFLLMLKVEDVNKCEGDGVKKIRNAFSWQMFMLNVIFVKVKDITVKH